MSFSRVTSKLMSDQSMHNLHLNLTRLGDLQNKLSSGKNINTPSDDPIGLNRLIGIDATLKQDERFVDNIAMGVSELNTTDKLLSSTTDIIQRARELTVQASNQTNGPDELSAIREEIEQLQSQLVQIANTKFGDKYLFGGVRTTLPPYSQVGTDIIYDGTRAPNHPRNMEIGVGVVVSTNSAGNDIFGENDVPGGNVSGLFETISTLVSDLNTAAAAPTSVNYDAIRLRLTDLDMDLDNVLSIQTSVGALVNRLDLTERRIEDRKLSLTREFGKIQDVDLAEVVASLNFQESVFQTSLAATSRVLQPTLLNYM